MDAGKLNQRINIEQRTSDQDAAGQPVETWSLVAAVWASIKYPTGLSAIKADADTSVVKASIRIRRRSGLNAGMRVVQTSAIFDIKAVLPAEDRQFIDLVCERIS